MHKTRTCIDPSFERQWEREVHAFAPATQFPFRHKHEMKMELQTPQSGSACSFVR
jgi:hypothetical protein